MHKPLAPCPDQCIVLFPINLSVKSPFASILSPSNSESVSVLSDAVQTQPFPSFLSVVFGLNFVSAPPTVSTIVLMLIYNILKYYCIFKIIWQNLSTIVAACDLVAVAFGSIKK